MTSRDELQRPTPGTIAITLMGWLELIASLILFLMEITIVACVFAAASVLLTLVAMLIRQPAWTADQRRPRETTSSPFWANAFRVLFITSLALAVLSIGGAVLMVAQGEGAAAVLMALWALSLGLQAFRLWPRK